MRFAFCTVIFLLLSSVGFSKTIHVPGDYIKIQQAINAAVNGDTVLVDPGTYKENLDFKNKAITVQSSSGASVTVVDGRKLDSVVKFLSGETNDSLLDGFTIKNGSGSWGGGILCGMGSSPVIKNNIITENTATGTLSEGGGISLKGGHATIKDNVIHDNSAHHGGGICCSQGAHLITGNVITNNSTGDKGGGIYVREIGQSLICKNTISNNSALVGGAICTETSTYPIIRDNVMDGNTAGYYGGAIYADRSAPIVERNVLTNNSAKRGGAIYAWVDVFLLVGGNLIVHNKASSSGGAIGAEDDNIVVAYNNIMAGNSAVQNGGAIYMLDSYADLQNNTITNNSAAMGGGIEFGRTGGSITNTIFWNNTAAQGKEIALSSTDPAYVEMSYSDVDGGQASVYVDPNGTLKWGPGMIDADPLFVDPAADDYHIRYVSLCRDAGDNGPVLYFEDFEGDPRMTYGTVDIGADEFANHLYHTGNPTPGGQVDFKITDEPNCQPVMLYIGTGVEDPPVPTQYGNWYLKFPLAQLYLGSIPADGVLILTTTVPNGFPPVELPMQAFVMDELTNLSRLEID